MYLPDRDCDLLNTLVFKVRSCRLDQIRDVWWPGEPDSSKVRDRLGELARRGFIHRLDPILLTLKKPLAGPLFSWEPPEEPPDANQLAAYSKQRWTTVPQPTAIYFASRFTIDWMGGSPTRLRRNDATHDVHLTQAYLHLRGHDPPAAAAWVGEDVKGKAGEGLKDPDAFLEYDDGRKVVIEFLGQSYTKKTILDFHEHCVKFKLAYQLW